jgi:hypothetical protein
MKKKLIILGSILGLMALVFFLVPFGINAYLNRNADELFREMILKANGFTDHQVHFEGISLTYHLQGTSLKIKKISIRPKEIISGERSKIEVSVEDLEISGFKWLSYFLESAIEVQRASIEMLNVISITPNHLSKSTEDKEKVANYKRILVEELQLRNFNFQNKSAENDSLRMRITSAFLTINEFALLQRHLQNPSSLFQVGHIDAEIEEVRLALDNYYQKLYLNGVYLNSKSSSFKISNVVLDQSLNKNAFSKAFDYRKDYLTLHTDDMIGTGIQWLDFFDQGNWHAEKISVQNPSLSVFINKQKPKNPNRKKLLFAEQIKAIRFPLRIDSLLFQNGKVELEEAPENRFYKNGKLDFSELNILVLNLTNQQEVLKDKSKLSLNVNGKLMNHGKIHLQIQQELANSSGDFTIQGKVGKMRLTHLNSILEPETQVSVNSGTLNEMNFKIKGNNTQGQGELIMKYEDLNIRILNKEDQKSSNFWNELTSLLANTFVLKSNNPNKRGHLVKGNISYSRSSDNSNLHYWWQLVLSGIKSTFDPLH